MLDLIEKSGVSPLQNLLTLLGGWPVLEGDKWHPTNWSWQNTISKLRESGLGLDYLIKVAVVPDLKNPSRRMLYVRCVITFFLRY